MIEMPINWIELGEKYTLTELEGIKQAIESLKDLHKEQHKKTEKEAYERVS
ncbi:hypothetical protein SAMN04487887_11525 [Enterococcus casseliflavus]|nr:hypothetical protein SAMN04487887_11525 [Enterococcus casseliflavus]